MDRIKYLEDKVNELKSIIATMALAESDAIYKKKTRKVNELVKQKWKFYRENKDAVKINMEEPIYWQAVKNITDQMFLEKSKET